jgi:hypothetical protein
MDIAWQMTVSWASMTLIKPVKKIIIGTGVSIIAVIFS